MEEDGRDVAAGSVELGDPAVEVLIDGEDDVDIAGKPVTRGREDVELIVLGFATRAA